MNIIIDRVWYDLVTTEYQAIYSSLHNKRIRSLSDGINIFTAFASSASVGGWAIWNSIPVLWGGIIAISQFINIAKPHIGKIRDYELYHELQQYYQERNFELDNLWLKISLGELTEEEINREYKHVYEKYFNLSKKFLKVRIEDQKKLERKALVIWHKSIAKYGSKNE